MSPALAAIRALVPALTPTERAEAVRLLAGGATLDGAPGGRARSERRVLSVSQAAERLPWRRSVAVRWLRERGLVRRGPEDRAVVVWPDVEDALRTGETPAPEPLPPTGPRPARPTRGRR